MVSNCAPGGSKALRRVLVNTSIQGCPRLCLFDSLDLVNERIVVVYLIAAEVYCRRVEAFPVLMPLELLLSCQPPCSRRCGQIHWVCFFRKFSETSPCTVLSVGNHLSETILGDRLCSGGVVT